MLTRSMLEMLSELALGVQVPEVHRTAGWAQPADGGDSALLAIKSGTAPPEDAFIAVPYRGYWFWIDRGDLRSKGTFSLLMFLFSLAETGGTGSAPVVTISAGS